MSDPVTPITDPPGGPEGPSGTDGKQERLLRAAAGIIAAEGTQALSIRRLAGEVGTSTMAVYTWYGNKPNLLRAVFREAFLRFGEQLRSVPRTEDPLLDLIRLGRAYRAYGLSEPNLYEVMFGRSIALFDPSEEDLEMSADTFNVLVDCVRRCADAGALTCDPLEGAWQIWAGVHGAMTLELLNNRPPTELESGLEDRFVSLTRTILAGLGAAPGRLDAAVRAQG